MADGNEGTSVEVAAENEPEKKEDRDNSSDIVAEGEGDGEGEGEQGDIDGGEADGGDDGGGDTSCVGVGDADDPRNNSKSSYRQKYKHAWELDTELRDWLTACPVDAYAGYCKYCRTKLHAHKKGLLAHAKSYKHKKNVSHYLTGDRSLSLLPNDGFGALDGLNGDLNGDFSDEASKRNHKGQRLFNDSWLNDTNFSQWLRKVPNNNTRALCIACRCVISAGKCELLKHTKAAKHKKAMLDGDFEEVSEADLQWLEFSASDNVILSTTMVNGSITQQVGQRGAAIDLPGLMVDDIIDKLEKHVPIELAEKWDNVGIITKPTAPVKIFNVLLTIDLNEKIVEEAIKKRVQFIISYHPPIFSPIKKLNPKYWKDKAILMCIEHRITVYSPHTALDAIKGGINDWLVSSFMTNDQNKIRPLQYSSTKRKTACLEVLLSESQETVAETFKDVHDVTVTDYGNSSTDVKVSCDDRGLPEILETLAQKNFAQLSCRVTNLSEMPIPGVGMGRLVTLETSLPLYEVVQRTKTHLDLTYIRLALSPKHTRDTKVNSIAVCAGSGSGVLKGCSADVWITGEMSHHDVLEAINTGSTVILCEHSNTERGFLREWSQQLRSVVFEDQVMVSVSEIDRDPLRIV